MSKIFPLLKGKHPPSILRDLQRGCFPPTKFRNFSKSYFPPKMTGGDLEKSQNYNEPGRTFHES
ncbi:hypothetical protein T11_13874 [Trichinella zimbabwensis]|uniref:Uncharacterized protein n=1 Tax=Trichinella zimbabwensis TaxID=268475 RepID=A0A0V1GM51_9BILA|nr:hypothetical protein T11_13874 [Trichinella zimbabwensis]